MSLADDPAARMLTAGDLRAVFLPARGMLGASLRHRGEELLGRVEDLDAAAAAGSACGIPLLHPWANRLAGMRYRIAGKEVSLDPKSPLLHFDANGLPMHGVPWSRLGWEVTGDGPASLSAQLEWDCPELLAIFPFPHRLVMAVSLQPNGLSIATDLFASPSGPVPVSFGFHPYLRLPGLTRDRWQVRLPPMGRLLLDARNIPIGTEVPYGGFNGIFGSQKFDDGFRSIEACPLFSIAGAGRKLTVEWIEGYAYVQVFTPGAPDQIALEPMTAPANALVSGDGMRIVPAGGRFRAVFRIGVDAIS